jgi:RNA polymerase primary sigma factor
VLTHHDDRSETLDQMLRSIEAQPQLNAQEEAELCLRAAAGDPAAAQELVSANLRRVVHVARGYRNMGLALEDLIHEGAVGLMQAVSRFDASRGVRFFTYASFLVRRTLVQAIARGSKTVRVPRHVAAKVRRFKEERARLSSGLGEKAGVEEVARSLGLGLEEAEAVANFQSPYELSVDETVGPEDGGTTRGDLLSGQPEDAPDCMFEADEDLSELRAALALLEPRDRLVLEARFGLDGQEPRTLRDLGARMDLSKERVRQLEERAKANVRERVSLRRRVPASGCAAIPA